MQLRKTQNGFYLGQRFIPKKRFLPLESEGAIAQKSDKVFTMTVSSETPYYRMELDMEEVLIHNSDAVNLSRFQSGKSMVLLNHNPDNYLARITQGWLDNGYLYIEAHFKECPELEDVRSQILQCTSVGYNIEEATVNDDQFVITKWTPLEASLVSVAADPSVGIIDNSSNKNKPDYSEEETQEDERTRQFNIRAVADKDGIPEWRVREAINSGESVKSFCDYAQSQRGEAISHYAPPERLNEKQRQIGANMTRIERLYSPNDRASGKTSKNPFHLGLSQKEKSEYSIAKLLRYASGVDTSQRPDFELEISNEISHRCGRDAKGVFVPLGELMKRDQGMSTFGQPSLVPEQTMEATSILRDKSVLSAAGATILTGQSDTISLPRAGTGTASKWLSEGQQIPEESLSFDPLVLQPHSLASLVVISRKLAIQAAGSSDIEMLILSDIADSMATRIQRAALIGGSEANEPEGIASSIDSIDAGGSQLSRSLMLDMEAAISQRNADINELVFVISPKTRRTLRDTPTDAGSGEFVYSDPVPGSGMEAASGDILGYRALVSSSMPDDHIILGDFSQLLISEFGVPDLSVNPYAGSAFSSGNLMIRGIQEVDCGVRRKESFAVLTNFSHP